MNAHVEFGCTAVPEARPTNLRLVGLAAQDLGYDRCWVPDQEFFGDPFLLLGDLAARTTIDLGLALTSPFSRHPVQIARAMATLVHLDPHARDWALGLGIGNRDLVLGPLGVAETANSKRLLESVDLIRKLVRGETAQAEGSSYLKQSASLGVEPVDCAVYVGTRGPRTLASVLPVADGVLTESLFTPQLVRWVRQQSGMDTGSTHVAWQSVTFLEPGQPIPDRTRAFATMLVRTTAPAVRTLLGVSAEVVERATDGSLESRHLTDEDVQAMVVVGTPGHVRERVVQAIETGVNGWSSVFLGSTRDVIRSMRTFAHEVMEPVRSEMDIQKSSVSGERPDDGAAATWSEAEGLTRRYYELVDAADTDGLLDLFSDDAVYERQGRPTITGRQELRRFYESERLIASGRHHLEEVVSGKAWVSVRGVFLGTLKSGERVEVEFTDWHRIEKTKITHRQSLFPGRAI